MKRWQRSDYIVLAILVAVVLVASSAAIIVERRHRMSEGLVRNPPWLMWGNSQTLRLESAGVTVQTGGQLNKIAYARPERWCFLFFATILDGKVKNPNGQLFSVSVLFNVLSGLGRSQVTMSPFEQFNFVWSSPTPVPVGSQRFSTSVIGPDRSGATPHTNAVTDIISWIPAQDIQVNAKVAFGGPDVSPGDFVVVQFDSYWSPCTHIRPEWFKGKMGQAEDEGR